MKTAESIQYYWPELVVALKETAVMLGISLSICLLLGLPLGILLFLSNRRRDGGYRLGYWLSNFVVTAIRSFPYLLLVITLIPFTRLVVGRGFGPVAASVSLSIVAVAIFARLVEQALMDVPKETHLLANSLGTSLLQYIRQFLLVEARSSIVLAYTTTVVSMVSYSTVMGIVGGGGIGDFAIRYGYQRYEYGVMYFAVAMMVVVVFIIQLSGNWLAKKIDKRKLEDI